MTSWNDFKVTLPLVEKWELPAFQMGCTCAALIEVKNISKSFMSVGPSGTGEMDSGAGGGSALQASYTVLLLVLVSC